jgi:hypothetical protein
MNAASSSLRPFFPRWTPSRLAPSTRAIPALFRYRASAARASADNHVRRHYPLVFFK